MKDTSLFVYPAVSLGMGLIGFVLHRLIWTICFDGLGLPQPGLLPTVLGFWLLAAAVVSLILALRLPVGICWNGVFRKRQKRDPLLVPGAVAFLSASICCLISLMRGGMLLYESMLIPVLMVIGSVGGAAGVVLSAVMKKVQPVYMLLPGFNACFSLVNFYHNNASDPVILHFCWTILAIASAAMGWYFLSGFAFERGNGFATAFFSMLAVIFSFTSLGGRLFLYEYLLMIAQILCFTAYLYRMAE